MNESNVVRLPQKIKGMLKEIFMILPNSVPWKTCKRNHKEINVFRSFLTFSSSFKQIRSTFQFVKQKPR